MLKSVRFVWNISVADVLVISDGLRRDIPSPWVMIVA